VYGNSGGGISVADGDIRESRLVNNAVQGLAGTTVLPGPRPGMRLNGNVDCTRVPCFVSPEAMDFAPLAGSLLIGPGMLPVESWMPRDDLFGTLRGIPPTVGAIERPSGPLPLAGWP
jgi:hypothetical protein